MVAHKLTTAYRQITVQPANERTRDAKQAAQKITKIAIATIIVQHKREKKR